MTTGRQHLHHEFTWMWTDKDPYYQCFSCHCPSKSDVFSHFNVCLMCDHCLIRFLSDYSTIPHAACFAFFQLLLLLIFHKCIRDFLPSPLSLCFPVSYHLLATAPSFLTLFNEFQDSFIPFLIYSSLSLQLFLCCPSGFPIVLNHWCFNQWFNTKLGGTLLYSVFKIKIRFHFMETTIIWSLYVPVSAPG